MTRWLLIALAACAASNAEIKTAKTAIYNGDPHALLEVAMRATAETYKIGEVDNMGLRFATQPKFYGAEGDLESSGAGNFVQLRAGSVRVTFLVAVIETDDHQNAITVVPQTFQVVANSPKPRVLAPDDPYLPTFVTGRANSLALAIYERAKGYVARPPEAK